MLFFPFNKRWFILNLNSSNSPVFYKNIIIIRFFKYSYLIDILNISRGFLIVNTYSASCETSIVSIYIYIYKLEVF